MWYSLISTRTINDLTVWLYTKYENASESLSKIKHDYEYFDGSNSHLPKYVNLVRANLHVHTARTSELYIKNTQSVLHILKDETINFHRFQFHITISSEAMMYWYHK